MSSTPCSNADSNFSVFHLDVVGLELDRQVELVLAGADVVLPAVPGTGQHTIFQVPLAERSLEMQAVALQRIEAAVAVCERELGLARLHRADRSGRNVLDASDGDEAPFHARDPSRGLEQARPTAIPSSRGDDPAVWGRCL